MTITNDHIAKLVSNERSASLQAEAAAYRLVRMITARSSTHEARGRGQPGSLRIPRQRQRESEERTADGPSPGGDPEASSLAHGCAA